MHTSSALRALAILLVALCLGVTIASSDGSEPIPPVKAKVSPATFSGMSNKGDFQEALNAALETAMASRKGTADAMIEWKVREISGAQGGFAGVKLLTVMIEVKPL